jgi:hypothetical protein
LADAGCGSGRATRQFTIDLVDWFRQRGDSDKLGLSSANVPQRRQFRRARQVRIEVHKAVVSAGLLLRVLVCGCHLLPFRRLQQRRLVLVGVLHRDLQGIIVIFFFRKVFCAKCRLSWCFWVVRDVAAL